MTTSALASATSSDNSTRQATQQKRLTENFDTFLTLLTAQLQNQDPLEPLKANEFTQQLVQFSSVEQALETNKLLGQLVEASGADSLTPLVGYIGKTVAAEGDAMALKDSQAQWRYQLEYPAKSVELRVLDDLGRTVYSQEGQTTNNLHEFKWDGKTTDGNQLEDGGVYRLQVIAADSSGKNIDASTQIVGPVRAIESGQDGAELVLDGAKAKREQLVGVIG